MEPSPCTLLSESFPKAPRTGSEASQFSESHNYKTKQTTLLHIFFKLNMYSKTPGQGHSKNSI
jgi:hypothetical protein